MSVKLIGIDIDGTLINSKTELTQATVDALQAAADHGIEVVISTGRLRSEYEYLIEQLPMMRYTVTCSGAQVIDLQENKTVFRAPLSAEDIREIYGRLRALDCLLQIFDDHDGRIHNRASDLANAERYCSPDLARMLRREHVPEDDLDAYVAAYEGVSNKVHMFFPDDAVKAQAAARLEGVPYQIMGSSFCDLELMASGVDKALGLDALAKHLGLERSQVMAIGDGGNDLAMLQYAGIGVAMGNASDEIKAAADRITASNDEDGVAQIIYEILQEQA